MNIHTEKLNLIKWLAGINEPAIIRKFIALKQEQQIDWWEEIDAEERSDIEAGLEEADRGEVISHEEVMAKYQKWRTK